jgi:hypothetical protein
MLQKYYILQGMQTIERFEKETYNIIGVKNYSRSEFDYD